MRRLRIMAHSIKGLIFVTAISGQKCGIIFITAIYVLKVGVVFCPRPDCFPKQRNLQSMKNHNSCVSIFLMECYTCTRIYKWNELSEHPLPLCQMMLIYQDNIFIILYNYSFQKYYRRLCGWPGCGAYLQFLAQDGRQMDSQ